MMSIVAHFWPWLLAIFAIGFATAFWIREPERRHRISRWLLWGVLAFVAGVIVAALRILFGRAGLWLETGLISFAIYLAGAILGVVSRNGDLREHRGWALGLVPAGLVWFLGNSVSIPLLEADLRDKAALVVKEANGDLKSLDVNGRDVTLQTGADDRDSLTIVIGAFEGVRQVVSADKPGADDSKSDGTTEASAIPHMSEAKPSGGADINAEVDKAIASKEEAATPPAPVAQTAMTAADAKSFLAKLPAYGSLDPSACQAALSATAALEKIEFRSASATIRRASTDVLNKLALVMKRCAEAKIEIGGHTDNVGGEVENRDLSQRRADAIMGYFIRMGVAAPRLSAVGYGAKKPIASNDTDEGKAENRRIEFIVK